MSCASRCQRTPGRVNPCALFSLCFCAKKAANSASTRRGWYHYPRRGPHAPKTLRGHGSGGRILPFYALRSPAAGVNAAPSFSAFVFAFCRAVANSNSDSCRSWNRSMAYRIGRMVYLRQPLRLRPSLVMISVRSVRIRPCSSSAATYFATVLTEIPSFLAMVG